MLTSALQISGRKVGFRRDTVAKVENRTTPKNLAKANFYTSLRLQRSLAPLRKVRGFDFLGETIWSLTLPREKRFARALEIFARHPKKTFSTISAFQPGHAAVVASCPLSGRLLFRNWPRVSIAGFVLSETDMADLVGDVRSPGVGRISRPADPFLTRMYGPAVRCNVWSGRALQVDFAELAVSGLASMYPASDWSICSGPSWKSARVRSH